MTLPQWITDMHLYLYLAIGGGLGVALALVLHFAPVSRTKVPGILVGIIGGLGAGVGLGVLAMGAFGWHWVQQEITSGDNTPPPVPEGGGGRGPNPKAQLASLISKLDVLTHKPLQVTLTAEQKTKVRELIQKLDENKELREDEAEAKLKELEKVLNEDQRKTLEAAGYRWPGHGGGGGRGGPPATPPNPFMEGQPKEHLKSLRVQLEDNKK